jgi:hypothetical protein
MPIPGLDARGVTPELKLRPIFHSSCIWWVFCFVLFFFPGVFVCLFVCFIIVGYFYFYFYSYFLSILSPYHHHLLIPTLTAFTLPSSPVLKAIALLPNYSFCPFSSTLPPSLTFPSNYPPTCHKTIPPSYRLTTCWPTHCTNFKQPQPPAIPDARALH